MKSLIHKYLIPHEANEHRPHLLRERALAVVLGLVLVGEVLFLSHSFILLPRNGMLAQVLSARVTDYTNVERQEYKLPQLQTNQLLVDAAQAKANDMASKGYFAHTTPDGKSPWYWLTQAGYKYEYAGENLAVNFFDSKDVVLAWMNSPSHRANILGQHYTDIGIATAEGYYKGNKVVFVVQYMGSQKAGSVAPKKSVNNANAFAAIIAAPREVTGTLFGLIAGLLVAVLVAVVIRSKKHDVQMIARALLVILVLLVMIIFNRELATFWGVI